MVTKYIDCFDCKINQLSLLKLLTIFKNSVHKDSVEFELFKIKFAYSQKET